LTSKDIKRLSDILSERLLAVRQAKFSKWFERLNDIDKNEIIFVYSYFQYYQNVPASVLKNKLDFISLIDGAAFFHHSPNKFHSLPYYTQLALRLIARFNVSLTKLFILDVFDYLTPVHEVDAFLEAHAPEELIDGEIYKLNKQESIKFPTQLLLPAGKVQVGKFSFFYVTKNGTKSNKFGNRKIINKIIREFPFISFSMLGLGYVKKRKVYIIPVYFSLSYEPVSSMTQVLSEKRYNINTDFSKYNKKDIKFLDTKILTIEKPEQLRPYFKQKKFLFLDNGLPVLFTLNQKKSFAKIIDYILDENYEVAGFIYKVGNELHSIKSNNISVEDLKDRYIKIYEYYLNEELVGHIPVSLDFITLNRCPVCGNLKKVQSKICAKCSKHIYLYLESGVYYKDIRLPMFYEKDEIYYSKIFNLVPENGEYVLELKPTDRPVQLQLPLHYDKWKEKAENYFEEVRNSLKSLQLD